MRRKIFINSQEYTIEGDEVYLSRVNEHFEQPTIDFFRTFVEITFTHWI